VDHAAAKLVLPAAQGGPRLLVFGGRWLRLRHYMLCSTLPLAFTSHPCPHLATSPPRAPHPDNGLLCCAGSSQAGFLNDVHCLALGNLEVSASITN